MKCLWMWNSIPEQSSYMSMVFESSVFVNMNMSYWQWTQLLFRFINRAEVFKIHSCITWILFCGRLSTNVSKSGSLHNGHLVHVLCNILLWNEVFGSKWKHLNPFCRQYWRYNGSVFRTLPNMGRTPVFDGSPWEIFLFFFFWAWIWSDAMIWAERNVNALFVLLSLILLPFTQWASKQKTKDKGFDGFFESDCVRWQITVDHFIWRVERNHWYL